MIKILSDAKLKEIVSDVNYEVKQLIKEIEELQLQNAYLEEENKTLKFELSNKGNTKLKLDIDAQIILREILRYQKDNKDITECFRDAEVIDNIINQINSNLEGDIKNEGNRNS